MSTAETFAAGFTFVGMGRRWGLTVEIGRVRMGISQQQCMGNSMSHETRTKLSSDVRSTS